MRLIYKLPSDIPPDSRMKVWSFWLGCEFRLALDELELCKACFEAGVVLSLELAWTDCGVIGVEDDVEFCCEACLWEILADMEEELWLVEFKLCWFKVEKLEEIKREKRWDLLDGDEDGNFFSFKSEGLL